MGVSSVHVLCARACACARGGECAGARACNAAEDTPPNPLKVFVGNLSPKTNEDAIKTHFASAGILRAVTQAAGNEGPEMGSSTRDQRTRRAERERERDRERQRQRQRDRDRERLRERE